MKTKVKEGNIVGKNSLQKYDTNILEKKTDVCSESIRQCVVQLIVYAVLVITFKSCYLLAVDEFVTSAALKLGSPVGSIQPVALSTRTNIHPWTR
jgi:hypothetical protein